MRRIEQAAGDSPREDGGRSLCLVGEIGHEAVFFTLPPGTSVVGSGSECHLRIRADGVSRRHALIDVEPTRGVRLVDRGSKNGTFVNGHRVRSADLQLGDEVVLGELKLRLEALGPADAELAISVAGPPIEPVEPTTASSTTLPYRAGSKPLDEWLGVVRRFVEKLWTTEADLGAGLSVVAESLGIDGLCFLELGDAGDPVIGAAWGEVDRPDLETLRERQEPLREGERLFLVDAGHTVYAARPPGADAVGVVAWGDFPGRRRSETLWETLLGLLLLFRGSAVGREEAAAPSAELRFPTGYVRGRSEPMRALYASMATLAGTDIPVLITGETGAGKELVARAFHLSSPRREGPFVAINCAAIPAELLEAELFGIAKGVASGVAARRGKFEQAGGGTLFLDEIGEMPPRLQAKLLRVLEERQIQPLGAAPLALEARVLAATNAPVSGLVERGALRADLYYRLAGALLRVPPLRERCTDIPVLVDRRLRALAEEADKPIVGMTAGALERLMRHPWPGNVRELDHELRRLVQICPRGQPIVSGMLSPALRSARAASGPSAAASPRPASGSPENPIAARAPERLDPSRLSELTLADIERAVVVEALRRSRGHRGRAAELLGLSRDALRRRIRRLGIAPSR